MYVALIGPRLPRNGVPNNGLEVFNGFLKDALFRMGHRVDYIPDTSYSNITNLSRTRIDYDVVILSGTAMNYAGIIRHHSTRSIVWSHGQHVSPFRYWNGSELHFPGNVYVATNGQHVEEAKVRGFEDKTIYLSIPIQFPPPVVKEASDYGIAIGTLEPRKDYARIAEIATALKIQTRVYGAKYNPESMAIIDESPFLTYGGLVSHSDVMRELSEAMFLIHAAKIEGHPTSTLEAMGYGVPVIVPDIPLYQEYVNPEYNLLLPDGMVPTEEDIIPLLEIENRRSLSDWAHNEYGIEVFQKKLSEILGESA